jgi:AsmA protein
VDAANGQLSLAPVSTNLYEGAFEGAVRLSVAEATPVARIEADLQRVNLEPLLADLMDASYVTGRGNVQLALTGRGEDADAIKRSLGGNGRIQLEDGILRGVDVAGVLTQLETMIRSRRPGNLQRGEQTAFDTFGASLAVQDGVITTNDLMIKSPGFQVAGRGTLLNLAEETIAFDLVASVDNATSTRNDQEYDIGGYALPIACTGSLEEPRCLPDAGEILRNAVQRELQDRVIDLLDRNLGRGDQQGQVTPQSGTQQTAPQTAPQQTAPQQTTPQQTTPQQQQPQDVREQIINRALDRIFN